MSALEAPKWAHGYRTDLEYTFGLYGFLNPDLLLLRPVLLGIDPSTSVVSAGAKESRNITYCELGSGQGMSLNFMAARDPGGTYIGVDYNPAQVKNARNFAEAANLKNVKIFEESFENLNDLDMPDLDVVVLHGIWSWISKDMREKIVKFLRKRLKPGGLCYNSYNCTVGRASELPMRRLFISAEKAAAGKGVNGVTNAVGMMTELSELGARYFAKNDVVKTRLKEFSKQDPAYIIHEYLNDDWHPFFFSEVADELGEAKLNFVGQYHMARNMPKLALPNETQPHFERFTKVADKELLKDIWSNSAFRQDIYIKGPQTLRPEKQRDILTSLRYTLAVPRENCGLNVQFPGGSAKLPEKPYAAILDALAEKIVSGAEILKIIKKEAPKSTISGVLSVLVAAGYISLAADERAVPRISKSLKGFDIAVADLAGAGINQFHVALPALASFKSFSFLNYYIWQATVRKSDDREGYVLDQLRSTGRQLLRNNEVVSDKKQTTDIIREHIRVFDATLRPLTRFIESRAEN